MPEDLKACPFCGSSKALMWVSYPDTREFDIRPDGYRAYCNDCGAKTRLFDEESEAVAAWNRRAWAWVPVADRLPDHRARVMTWDGEAVREAMLNDGCWETEVNYAAPITHWIPLPEPPAA